MIVLGLTSPAAAATTSLCAIPSHSYLPQSQRCATLKPHQLTPADLSSSAQGPTVGLPRILAE